MSENDAILSAEEFADAVRNRTDISASNRIEAGAVLLAHDAALRAQVVALTASYGAAQELADDAVADRDEWCDRAQTAEAKVTALTEERDAARGRADNAVNDAVEAETRLAAATHVNESLRDELAAREARVAALEAGLRERERLISVAADAISENWGGPIGEPCRVCAGSGMDASTEFACRTCSGEGLLPPTPEEVAGFREAAEDTAATAVDAIARAALARVRSPEPEYARTAEQHEQWIDLVHGPETCPTCGSTNRVVREWNPRSTERCDDAWHRGPEERVSE